MAEAENANFQLIRASENDTLNPVRQGGVGNRPYWNIYARQFIYVPAFDFEKVRKASCYRFSAEDRFGTVHSFTADSPSALLTPIWKELPVGPVYLTVDALNCNGRKIKTAGFRVFYKNAAFCNSYPAKTCSYAECARKTYDYLFSRKEIQGLADGKPDLRFTLFCYPSKMYSSIISGMVSYAEMVPEKKARAMKIARSAADYLIEKAVPKGEKLEYLPQTYEGDKLAAGKFAGTIMMLYPASVGNAMISLYRATREKRYFEYALRIGDQYLRLQQPNGSWFLNLKIANGKPKEQNYCAPDGIMGFLERLSEISKRKKYSLAAKKGIPWMRQMFDTFNWEGQFEDVEAQQRNYCNMTFHNATGMYQYLCRKTKVTRELIREAREIQRYSEDQFIIWEQPGWAGSSSVWDWRTKEELQAKKWGWLRFYQVPCTLEQYRCYVPVDASSATMIRYYLMMYDLEKNPLDLAKARALGDSLTRLQESSGRIPTWSDHYASTNDDWINCMYATAHALKNLAVYDRR